MPELVRPPHQPVPRDVSMASDGAAQRAPWSVCVRQSQHFLAVIGKRYRPLCAGH